MDSLIICHCRHSMLSHTAAAGCGIVGCRCALSPAGVLEAEVTAAKREYQELYRRYADPNAQESA